MTIFLFSLAILTLVLQNIGYKLASRYVRQELDPLLFTSLILTFVAGISLLLLRGFVWNPMTLAVSALFAVFFALCEYAYMMALATGPMSFASLFLSCALVIPAVAGVVFWGEEWKWLRGAGIALLIGSFLLGLGGDKGEKKITITWLLFGFLTFFANGMVSVMQKVQSILVGSEQDSEFMVLAFLLAAALMWLIYGVQKIRVKGVPLSQEKGGGIRKPVILITLLTAIASAMGNRLVLYSAARIDAGILFPILNGGILMLCSLAAAVFFRERLSGRQWSGLLFGVGAVLLISL